METAVRILDAHFRRFRILPWFKKKTGFIIVRLVCHIDIVCTDNVPNEIKELAWNVFRNLRISAFITDPLYIACLRLRL
jgi:hypothetical protein